MKNPLTTTLSVRNAWEAGSTPYGKDRSGYKNNTFSKHLKNWGQMVARVGNSKILNGGLMGDAGQIGTGNWKEDHSSQANEKISHQTTEPNSPSPELKRRGDVLKSKEKKLAKLGEPFSGEYSSLQGFGEKKIQGLLNQVQVGGTGKFWNSRNPVSPASHSGETGWTYLEGTNLVAGHKGVVCGKKSGVSFMIRKTGPKLRS